MRKVQFSDVTPPEKKRSIRDIPIPAGSRRRSAPSGNVPINKVESRPVAEKPLNSRPEPEPVEKIKSDPYEYYYPQKEERSVKTASTKSKKPILLTAIVLLFIAGFAVSMMTVFASATLTVIPKSKDVTADLAITASNTEEGGVKYEVLKLSKTKTASIAATGEEMVEDKASGKIVIYNNFSTEPQRLIVRTRLESPEGLIYRIPESIVIPGKTIKDGVETPGSIEIVVYADEAGDKYNIKKSDFTVPGFKTDAARYKGFYARSVTPMTGGFVGKRKTVSKTDQEAALKAMDAELQSDLQKELGTKIPKDLVFLNGSIIYESNDLPIKEDGSNVEIGKEITGYALLLNSQDLSKKIASSTLSKFEDWNNIPAKVLDFSGLSVSNLPKNIESAGKIELKVSGQAKMWASIDTAAVSQSVIGAPKSKAQQLANEYPGVSSIEVRLRPIWKQSFPNNPAKIHVETSTGPQI